MATRRGTILLAEDDEDLRGALRDFLQDAGYGVWTAANGKEALDCLRERGGACLILLDLMMPVMNGWELRAELARDPRLARIPIVVCTAAAHAEERARELGAVGWISKPADVDRLIRLVETHCPPGP